MAYNEALAPLYGIRKIEQQLLERMTSRYVKGADGKRYPGLSSNELLAFIRFLKIADTSYTVEAYHLLDLAFDIGCDRRDVYLVKDALVKKGFARFEKTGQGVYKITLLVKSSKKRKKQSDDYDRYLSLDKEIFHFGTYSYETFKATSLFAKRAALWIMFHYSSIHGYRSSFDNLKAHLQIADSRNELVAGYIKEMNNLLDFFHKEPLCYSFSKHPNLKPDQFKIKPSIGALENKVDENSFFRYSFLNFLKSNKVDYLRASFYKDKAEGMFQDNFKKLVWTIRQLIENGKSYQKVMDNLHNLLIKEGKFDTSTIITLSVM
ncbi:MAG: hypothetical protein IJN92_08720 [Lachnospiraceae bacterium]|nr:hypothetical protein [Lachnospiraceae bacterium]